METSANLYFLWTIYYDEMPDRYKNSEINDLWIQIAKPMQTIKQTSELINKHKTVKNNCQRKTLVESSTYVSWLFFHQPRSLLISTMRCDHFFIIFLLKPLKAFLVNVVFKLSQIIFGLACSCLNFLLIETRKPW